MGRETQADLILAIKRVADAPRIFYARRPIHIYEQVDGEPKVVEERPHLDVLIDRVDGTRSVLQKLTDPEKIARWHVVAGAETTKVLACPLTCTRQQLPLILDRESKHLFAFGGNQSGKTRIAGHFLFDRILWNSGLYLWLAPSLEKTRVGVETLTVSHDFAAQVIPQELVLSAPTSERSGDQAIRLIDGTEISLRYCSRKGDNLKGLTGVRAAVMDEGTSVPHEINFTIATNRLLLAGGQLMVPTTPVHGHWLQTKDKETLTYDEIETRVAAGDARPAAAKSTLSCFDNPWIPPGEVDRTIESLGGIEDPRVKREVLGLWVAEGLPLWTHFDVTKHCVTWGGPDVERYGYVDITSIVGKSLFRGMTRATNFRWLGGQDFNFDPYSLVLCKFLCRQDDDQSDPDNWILYVEDVVSKRAKSTAEYSDWLSTQAAAWNGRGLPKDTFAGLHVIADGEGFYRNRDLRRTVSDDAKEMKRAGFVVRAPKYSEKNKAPCNPPRDVRIGWLNDLLYRKRILVNTASMRDGTRCAELIDAFEHEVQGKKQSNTKADRMSGPTDGLGYLAYAALYHRRKAANDDQPSIVAHVS